MDEMAKRFTAELGNLMDKEAQDLTCRPVNVAFKMFQMYRRYESKLLHVLCIEETALCWDASHNHGMDYFPTTQQHFPLHQEISAKRIFVWMLVTYDMHITDIIKCTNVTIVHFL